MQVNNGNLKIAIQKKGRLSEKSLELLKLCGIDVETYSERLVVTSRNFQLDVLFLRDDDIPEYVQDGVADIGIVGEDVLFEKDVKVDTLVNLGFGKCKLMIASPTDKELDSPNDLNGKKIATSHPKILSKYLVENNVSAKVIEISGSVEIAPSLGVADYICDIVSTGATLMMNKLKKSFSVFDSQAVMIGGDSLKKDPKKKQLVEDLQRRINSVLTAQKSKYLMMNVDKKNLEKVVKIIPSLKSPTVLPLADENLVAIHAVIPKETFWQINSQLKESGATGILLLPIDNMIV